MSTFSTGAAYLFILVKDFCLAEVVSRLDFYISLKHQVVNILTVHKLVIIQ